MAILNLPYQDIIERESGPLSEGFDIIEVSYSSKVSQIAFKGPSVEASRTERWRVFWKLLKKDVDGVGVPYSIDTIRDFYRLAQTNKVRWKPFELEGVRIWRVLPNSLSVKNPAGTNFEASIDLEFLYKE